MKQLTIEHLAAYLPYGVKCKADGDRKTFTVIGEISDRVNLEDRKGVIYSFHASRCRLILRPLSQLTEQITHNGETFVPLEVVKSMSIRAFEWYGSLDADEASLMPYAVAQKLLSWHFDIFSLGADDLCVYMNPDGTLSK